MTTMSPPNLAPLPAATRFRGAISARLLRPRRWYRANAVLSALLVCTLVVEHPSTARASIFGEESAILSAILGEDIAQVAQMVQTVANLYTQIRQLTTMIQQGATVLQNFKSPEDIQQLLGFAQSLLAKGGTIERNIRLLHFKLNAIDQDRHDVFPEMRDVSTDEFQARAQTWNAALKESSMVAMRAQTSVDTLQARLEHAQKLQQDSEAAEGVVGQLQIVVKSLALLHTDLASIEANLAYGQRVTATWAGVQSAEEDRAAEESRRMLENYTSRGGTPRKLSKLP